MGYLSRSLIYEGTAAAIKYCFKEVWYDTKQITYYRFAFVVEPLLLAFICPGMVAKNKLCLISSILISRSLNELHCAYV